MVLFFVQLHFTTRVRYGFLSVQLNYTIRHKNNYKPLTLNIFGSGGTAITFTGALYAPDADVVVNIGSGCVFEGSIYSRDFDVVSSGAQFRYRDIFSGSSSGSGTTSTKSRLVEDSSLVWNS